MTLGICAVCGYPDSCIEQHHVAGEANFPDLTVPVCLGCHTELHKRLAAHGVELRRDAERSFGDRMRALAAGFTEVHRLHLEYHPIPLLPAEVVALMGRVMLQVMDRLEPPDRPGRWLPDPTVRVEEVTPAESREGGDDDMLILLLQLGIDMIDSIEHSPAHDAPEIAVLRIVAADPLGFIAHAEATAAGLADSQALLQEMTAAVARIHRLLAFMASHDPDAEWPADMLAEAALWGDTMRRLLQHLIDLAGLTEEVA